MILEKAEENIPEGKLEGMHRHALVMDEYDRTKGHQRFTTSDGVEGAFSLPDGERLHPGDIFFQGDDDYVEIVAAKEKAFVIKPQSAHEWGIVGYNTGNMHKRAYINGDAFLVPYDEIFTSVLDRIGVSYTVEEREISGTDVNQSALEHRKVHAHGHV